MRLRSIAVISVLAVSVWPGVSVADAVADFYGRTALRMVIAADPGGSYDSDARLVARHLGRHIAGNPKIILENMIGASGRVAANYISISGEIGRPLLTAPGAPADRVAALRQAFIDTMADLEFQGDAAQMEREIHPIPGLELEALVRRELGAPKSAIDLLKAALARRDR
jgi:tripartite-type tricarboxylate transporter receptor subunit TctC